MLLPSTTALKCQIYNFTDSTSRRSPPLPPRKATQTSPKFHRSITNSLKSSAKRSWINYQSTAPMTTHSLQEGTAPLFGPIYNLSPAELEYLRKYIDENLSKHFLRHSQSPAAAPPSSHIRTISDASYVIKAR